jgi:hypothetical protein
MKGGDRIWILVARKWAGEATEEELKELEQWQRQHPDDVYTLQILADLLNTQRPTDKTAAEQAFDEHMLRLEEHLAAPARRQRAPVPRPHPASHRHRPGDTPLPPAEHHHPRPSHRYPPQLYARRLAQLFPE